MRACHQVNEVKRQHGFSNSALFLITQTLAISVVMIRYISTEISVRASSAHITRRRAHM